MEARLTASPLAGLRIAVIDDSLFVREGLQRILVRLGADVVAQAEEPVAALMEIARTLPDVVVTDVRMPPSRTNEGILLAEQIRAAHPRVGVLILAQDAEMHDLRRLFDRHQRSIGYLLKDRVTDHEDFAQAVRRVADGGMALDPHVVELLIRARGRQTDGEAIAGLSDRELTVLALMAEGLTNRAIAERLTLNTRTVETHVRSVFLKLGFSAGTDEDRRVLAVVEYLQARRAD